MPYYNQGVLNNNNSDVLDDLITKVLDDGVELRFILSDANLIKVQRLSYFSFVLRYRIVSFLKGFTDGSDIPSHIDDFIDLAVSYTNTTNEGLYVEEKRSLLQRYNTELDFWSLNELVTTITREIVDSITYSESNAIVGGGTGGGTIGSGNANSTTLTTANVITAIDTSTDVESIKQSLLTLVTSGVQISQTTIQDAIDAAIDVESIKVALTDIAINTNSPLTQNQVRDAVDASVDIEAIKNSLATIAGVSFSTITQNQVRDAVDASVDVEAIKNSVATLVTNALTQNQVRDAIDASVDIEALKTKLDVIVTNTTSPITQNQVRDAIDASVDIEAIKGNIATLVSQTASPITQNQVRDAIDASLDIEAIKGNIATLVSQTASPITPAQVTTAIDASFDIEAIKTSLSTIAGISFSTLTQNQVRDAIDNSVDIEALKTKIDTLISQTNWSLSQAEVQAALDASVDIESIKQSLLTLVSSGIAISQTTIQNAIDAALDIESIKTALNTIATNTNSPITQNQVRDAIDASVDIEALKTKLDSVNTNLTNLTTKQSDNSQTTRITDGTNTGTIKAASTSPVAADTAVVVALSPNGNQATAANQATELASLSSIDTKLTNAATTTLQTAGNAILSNILTKFTDSLQITRLTDGTNTATIKAASVVPVATDPALVVAISPNGNQSTAANQVTELASLSSIDGKLTNAATTTLQTAGNTILSNILTKFTDSLQITRISDGVRQATVKAASTAPVAADTALVVTISPNGNSITTTPGDLRVAGNTAPGGSGAITANTLRITTATDDPSITNIGTLVETTVNATPATTGSLKGILRGYWQNFLDVIGTVADVTIPAIPQTSTSTVKGLLRYLARSYSPTRTVSFISGEAVNEFNLNGTSGIIRAIYCVNDNGADFYLQIHSKASALVLNDLPFNLIQFPLRRNGGNNYGVETFGFNGTFFCPNLRIGISKDATKFVAAAQAKLVVCIEYYP